MIRPFEKLDMRRIKLNKFSCYEGFLQMMDDSFRKFTMEDDEGKVVAIFVAKSYWEDNYLAFILMSEDIRPIHAKELKKHIHRLMMDYGVKRIQTDSQNDPVLNRWHRFLGFTLEGTRKKMFHGKDYNMWGLVWE